MRFPSVLTRQLDQKHSLMDPRTFKYDESQLEFFVETASTVTLRKKDLEAIRSTKALDPAAGEEQDSFPSLV